MTVYYLHLDKGHVIAAGSPLPQVEANPIFERIEGPVPPEEPEAEEPEAGEPE